MGALCMFRSLHFLGGETLTSVALAELIGMVVGTDSSPDHQASPVPLLHVDYL